MMDVRTFLITEMMVGFVITFLVTVLYGVVAPWYKQAAGRYIFSLLLSLTAVLGNSVFHIFFPQFGDAANIIAVVLFAYYVIAVLAIGVGIYKAQVGGYRKRKFVVQEKERHREL